MCHHCTMSQNMINRIEIWGECGLVYTNLDIMMRPSARAYPNTFVFLFRDAINVGPISKDIWVDAHYEGTQIEGGRNLVAIGGLWVRGINGAMKPQQHGGELLRALMNEIPRVSPKPNTVEARYGEY